MAKIYISYSHQDKDIATEISQGLQELGHSIQIDFEVLTPGTEWRSQLQSYLQSSDAIVVLISENSVNSQYVMSEIGAARSYVSERERKKLLLPVVLGNIQIPPVISDLLAIVSAPPNVLEIVERVNQAIASFIGRKTAMEEEEAEIKKEIETSATEYIEDAIAGLQVREQTNRKDATMWYRIGWWSLIIGIIAAIIVAYFGYSKISEPAKLSASVFLTIKGIIIIALLIASSQYSFTLAKSYMAESLKNADRIHAISFGKFFIKAFGNNATISDIKEVFQHWNIETKSSFTTLDAKEYDPKFIENIIKLAELIKSSDKKKT